MKKFIIPFLIGISAIFSLQAQIELNPKASEFYYTNPIIPGMNPDPSICRVGEDYYLVTSSFGFFPALPIYHSRDLVNWRLIGHGISKREQLDFRENKKDGLNMFAATIRYHNGMFYIICTNVGRDDADRNFVITAKDPSATWSEAHFIADAPRIDPSLFFDDDGKVYYTGNDVPKNPVFKNQRTIWAQEIDNKTWQLLGEPRIILDPGDYYGGLQLGGKESEGLNHFEGPHLYKKDGAYYLLVSHGGTFWDHAVSIWKSDSMYGPYVLSPSSPIVTNRDFSHDAYIHHTGHADLVEAQEGAWWMVLLGVRPYAGGNANLGRETTLVPVDWSGDWPVVNPLGPVGRVMPTHKRPKLENQPWPAATTRDDFKEKTLDLNWYFMQVPSENWWSLNDPKGYLTLKLRPEIIEKSVNPSFIGRKQTQKNFTVTTKMEFVPKQENEVAGMVVTRDVGNQFQLILGLKAGKQMLRLLRRELVDGEDQEKIIAEAPITGRTVYLRINALEELFSFEYSMDEKNWTVLTADQDGRMLGEGTGMGRFTGTFIGMYGSSNGKASDNSAVFDWFEYEGF